MSILEVGCGDAHVVSEMERFFTIESYCGIELSRMALDFAATKLKGKVQNLELVNGDLVEEMRPHSRQV